MNSIDILHEYNDNLIEEYNLSIEHICFVSVLTIEYQYKYHENKIVHLFTSLKLLVSKTSFSKE